MPGRQQSGGQEAQQQDGADARSGQGVPNPTPPTPPAATQPSSGQGGSGAPSGGQAPSGPSLDDQVMAALGRLADSGRIVAGGDEQGEAGSNRTRPSSSPSDDSDLRASVEAILAERESARQERDRLGELETKVKELADGAGKTVKRWFEPWSPWSS